MTVRPAQHSATVPLSIVGLGALVVASGWLVIQGLPFIVGCAVACGAALAAVALLTTRRPADR